MKVRLSHAPTFRLTKESSISII